MNSDSTSRLAPALLAWALFTAATAPAQAPGTTASTATTPTPQTTESRRLSAAKAIKLHADENVVLDGKIDEPVWARAIVVDDFFEYRPREAPSRYKTEARIAYDSRAIYFAIRAYDPDPRLIEAPLVKRDQVLGSQDFFGVYLDPAGSRKFAQMFRVNAAGAVGDGLFNEDTQNEDFSPDFEWDVAVARLTDGWSAEFRIPFSTMRYSSPPSETWSVFIVRGITRSDVFRIANGRLPRDANCLLCYAQSVTGLTALPDGRELTITPNFTLRNTRDRESGRGDRNKRDNVVGVDVKFRPSADWVIDATINPDFSQVELDTPQLAANAQFALFFPEQRPFFLEGADILSSPFNAIYTRSISDPAWGVRATKRADDMDLTFMTLRDDGKGLILLPGALSTNVALQDSKSQASIVRGRWHLGSVTLGMLGTHRAFETSAGKPTLTNSVIGVDTVWRPAAEWRVRSDLLFSNTHDERNRINGKTSAGDVAALTDYNFRSEAWNIAGGVERVGLDFRADNGFFGQVGYLKGYQETQRKWREIWGFDEIAPYLNIEHRTDLNGALLYQQANLGVSFNIPKVNFGIEARPNQQVRFRETGRPLKRDQMYFWVDTTPGDWLSSFYAEGGYGDRGDVANNRVARGYFLSMNATIRLFHRWELQPRLDESVINAAESVSDTKRLLHERAFQLTSIYHLTARDSVRLIGQYNGVRRAPSLYESRVTPFDKSEVVSLVYGHRRGLGTNFYVGFTSSRAVEPEAAYQRRINEVFVKGSYAFDLSRL